MELGTKLSEIDDNIELVVSEQPETKNIRPLVLSFAELKRPVSCKFEFGDLRC